MIRQMVADVSCNAQTAAPHSLASTLAEIPQHDRITTLDSLEFPRQGATQALTGVGSNQGQTIAFVGQCPAADRAIDDKYATALAPSKLVPHITQDDRSPRSGRSAKPSKISQATAQDQRIAAPGLVSGRWIARG